MEALEQLRPHPCPVAECPVRGAGQDRVAEEEEVQVEVQERDWQGVAQGVGGVVFPALNAPLIRIREPGLPAVRGRVPFRASAAWLRG